MVGNAPIGSTVGANDGDGASVLASPSISPSHGCRGSLQGLDLTELLKVGVEAPEPIAHSGNAAGPREDGVVAVTRSPVAGHGFWELLPFCRG